MLKIKKEVIEKLLDHARCDAPIEACGYLAAKKAIVVKHYELKNIDESREHFSMDPAEQFNAVRDMRSQGLELRAVYHSHPETPARPSEEDKKLAHDENLSYMILSLADNNFKSFLIKKSEVQNEDVEVIEERN